MTETRRAFLSLFARLGAAIVVSRALSACSAGTDGGDPGVDTGQDPGTVDPGIVADFLHGVASGDPQRDSVILWTRVSPAGAEGEAVVHWDVARDAGFSDRTHSGTAPVNSDTDYTLKVAVRDLAPGTRYYYRFRCGDRVSLTGETRTLPDGHIDELQLAVVSCANYPAGFFHVYRELATRQDLAAIVHLGDYLYEYGSGDYGTENAAAIGRALPEAIAHEAVSLSDYRRRYALYRQDADLVAAHQRHPFIVVWDDHEIANDAWQDGAQNHSPEEGDYISRRTAALQAWFEWMPIGSPDDGISIYRDFQFGDLVNLTMLDTRHLARDRQLDYADYFSDTEASPLAESDSRFDEAAFNADVTSPQRSLLGSTQRDWLVQRWLASDATWQVLGQQVLMARMHVPRSVLPAPDADTILALYDIRVRMAENDPTLTDAERALFDDPIPYNLDAWDGYAYERDDLLAQAAALDINLVSLAGDTHNAWASDLQTSQGMAVGIEFATPSISSPGLEHYIALNTLLAVRQAEVALVSLVDTLRYVNIHQRGWLEVHFTHQQALARWQFVSSVASRDYHLDTARERQLRVLAGSANRRLVGAGD